jgi:hypothetical protein
MDMQTVARQLDEALIYYRCLETVGHWNKNSGTKALGDWFGAELARYQNLMTSNSFDAIGVINEFYTGLNMEALRNAYDDYRGSGCIEKQLEVGGYEWTYDPVTQQAGFTTRTSPFVAPAGSGTSLLGDGKGILLVIAAVVIAMMWSNKGGGDSGPSS